MYRKVGNAALIEAAQRIAPLVRACRDEGERDRRLPAHVLAAMHAAVLDAHSEGAGWPRNRPDHVDDCRRGDRPCRRRGGVEFDARRHLRSVGGILALPLRAHVEQVDEEVVRQRLRPVGEDAMHGLPGIRAQDAPAPDLGRGRSSGRAPTDARDMGPR